MSNNTAFSTILLLLLLLLCQFLWMTDVHNLNQVLHHDDEKENTTMTQTDNLTAILPKIFTIPQPTKETTPKRILFLNSFWHWKDFLFGFGQEPFIKHGCPVNQCFTTNQLNHFGSPSEFDSVVIHGVGFHLEKMAKYIQSWRKPNQRFVYFMLESPNDDPIDYHKVANFYNWTMTYRWDSDITMPYGWFQPKSEMNKSFSYAPDRFEVGKWPVVYDEKHFFEKVLPTKSSAFRNLAKRPKKVAWVVSHCKTSSKREYLVTELKKYIDIDIFGSCSGVPCDVAEKQVQNGNCSTVVERDYKFYLSFENSFATDYVTEKLFSRADHQSLPIVLGQANYSSVAPPHSLIDVLDFSNVKELADYLHLLDKNESLYLSYFWWHDHYSVVSLTLERFFCKLCSMLHDGTLPNKTYDDFDKWWRGDGRVGEKLSLLNPLIDGVEQNSKWRNFGV